MLAAIIANLQNQPEEPQRLPTVNIDRGGGGPSWPRHEIIDIVSALATFQEIPGEHPVARAVRRHKHVGDVLPKIKEARDNREAAAFMVGLDFGRHVALQEMMKLYDDERATKPTAVAASVPALPAAVPVPVPTPARAMARSHRSRGERGEDNGGGALGVLLFSALAIGAICAVKKLTTR